MLREIAQAAGSRKLIAGQVADLEAEGQESHARSNFATFTKTKPPRS